MDIEQYSQSIYRRESGWNFFLFSGVFCVQIIWNIPEFLSRFASRKTGKAGESTGFRNICRSGGTGRRAGLKIQWWQHRVGSSPTFGTSLVVGREVYPDLLNLRSEATLGLVNREVPPSVRKLRAENCKNKIYDYLCPTLKKLLISCRNGGPPPRKALAGKNW